MRGAPGGGRAGTRRGWGRGVMGVGNPPREVAGHTVDCRARGDFLIETDASAYLAAGKRAEEVKAAYAAQFPLTGDDPMKYHVGTVIARLSAKS